MAKRWSEEELELLKGVYPTALTEDLQQLFPLRSCGSLYNKAYELGVTKTKEFLRQTAGSNSRVYKFNESYFSEIDTQDKAYLLGFIWADGGVDDKHYKMTLNLRYDDVEVIHFLQSQVGSSHKLGSVVYSKPTHHDNTYICLCSMKMHSDLVKLGVKSRKSYLQTTPPSVNNEFKRHFIRGLFDGDGTLNISKKRQSNVGVKIVNTTTTCAWLLDTISEELGVGGGIYKITDTTYRYDLGGRRQVCKFANWIYTDASFFLSRKYNKFIGKGLI